MKKAIVLGVGPDEGLGAQLALRFAKEGMHVFVGSRSQSSLDVLVAKIQKSGGTATAVQTDATHEDQVLSLFEEAGEGLELAVYNAGNNYPGRIVEMDAEYFETSWRVVCYGGFLFGKEAVKRMLPQGKGTLIFTGASGSLRGRAHFGAFNSAKAGLRTLAQAMAKEYGAEGIHVAHVIVDGAINGEKIKTNLPEYAAKLGNEGMINLEGIVDAYLYLHQQRCQAWSFELDLRTFLEKW